MVWLDHLQKQHISGADYIDLISDIPWTVKFRFDADFRMMKHWILVFGTVLFLGSCNYYYGDCGEPQFNSLWQEVDGRGTSSFKVLHGDSISYSQFDLSNIDSFYIDVSENFYGCKTYSEVQRRISTCRDCPYEFIIDQMAREFPNEYETVQIYLYRNGQMIDSNRTSDLWRNNWDTVWIGNFAYSQTTGLIGYETDTLSILRQ